MMLDGLKRRWREIREGRPGSRFESYYDGHRKKGARRALYLVGGGLVIGAGLFFMPAPGPGLAIFAVGAGIMAQGSRTTARALDRLEVLARALLQRAVAWWRGAGSLARVAAAAAGLVLIAGAAYGGYRVFLA